MIRYSALPLVVILSATFAFSQIENPARSGPGDLIPPNDPRIAIMGRVDSANPARIRIGYPGVTFRLRFEGTSLSMRASADTPNNIFAIIVDGGAPRTVRFPPGESELAAAESLAAGEHSVDIARQTETWLGIITILGFRVSPGGTLLTPNPLPRRRMMFIGDSVTCAEAMDRSIKDRSVAGTTDPAAWKPDSWKPDSWKKDRPTSWNAYNSYGMILGRTFDAQVHLVCYGGRGLLRDFRNRRDVLNAPQFFDLAVPDEQNAPIWHHSAYIPDVVVVSLGTNDFTLGIPSFPERAEWVATYVRFVHAIRSVYPDAQILLTDGSLVNDDDPARPQKTVLNSYLQEIATRLTDPRVHVFTSRHYPGDPTDGHPTAQQHAAMARDMEPAIRAAIGW